MKIFVQRVATITSIAISSSFCFGQPFGQTGSSQNTLDPMKQRIILERRFTPVTLSEKLLAACKDPTTTNKVIASLIQKGASVLYRDDSGVSPLMSAVFYSKDPAVIETLLAAGAEVNIKSNYGQYTPLLAAAYGNQGFEVFSLLLEANADTRVKTKSGYTVFHILMENQPSAELVALLLEHGADVHALQPGYRCEWSPLQLTAENNPSTEVVRHLLDAGADINEAGEDGKTPIMFALKAKAPPETIMLLLEHGAELQTKTTRGETPLHYAAAYSDSLEVVEEFLRRGADLHAKGKFGGTPIISAARRNDSVEVIQKLLDEGADVNVHGSLFQQTPIHFAASYSSVEKVKAIIAAGANVNDRGESFGNTPLMKAAETNRDPEVLKLLLAAGADIKATNDKGQTALMLTHKWLKEDEHVESANVKHQILLDAGALTITTDHDGKTAADYQKLGMQSLERFKRPPMCGGTSMIIIRDFE